MKMQRYKKNQAEGQKKNWHSCESNADTLSITLISGEIQGTEASAVTGSEEKSKGNFRPAWQQPKKCS
jgi:uncharacterized protein YhfF